ncbi:MAG: hypothetical protein ACFFBP_02905 [Promethearchaeota archaeon]
MNTQTSSQSEYQQKPHVPKDIGKHSIRSLAFGITTLGLNLAAGIIFLSPLKSEGYHMYH